MKVLSSAGLYKLVSFLIILNGYVGAWNRNYLDESKGNRKSVSLCNPNTSHLFTKFFIQRWMDARAVIGMSISFQESNDPTKFIFDTARFLIARFNLFTPGAAIYYARDGTVITYAILRKCASEGINLNLNRLTTTVANEKPIRFDRVQYQSNLDLMFSIFSQKRPNHLASRLQNNDFKVFTFVRDPFDRFVAGFTEAVFSTFRNKQLYLDQQKNMEKINVTAVKEYLDEIFNFGEPLNIMGHYSPMAGVFFNFNIHILGHVKTFKSDWDNIIQPLYNITTEFNESLGTHRTSMHHPEVVGKVPPESKDPNNARQSLTQFLEMDVRYKQAICHLILIDYICLPMYALPAECQHLNATRDAAIEAVTNGHYVPHKVIHMDSDRHK